MGHTNTTARCTCMDVNSPLQTIVLGTLITSIVFDCWPGSKADIGNSGLSHIVESAGMNFVSVKPDTSVF